jgi:hypothetical protein
MSIGGPVTTGAGMGLRTTAGPEAGIEAGAVAAAEAGLEAGAVVGVLAAPDDLRAAGAGAARAGAGDGWLV